MLNLICWAILDATVIPYSIAEQKSWYEERDGAMARQHPNTLTCCESTLVKVPLCQPPKLSRAERSSSVYNTVFLKDGRYRGDRVGKGNERRESSCTSPRFWRTYQVLHPVRTLGEKVRTRGPFVNTGRSMIMLLAVAYVGYFTL